jgi:hypothetical protein
MTTIDRQDEIANAEQCYDLGLISLRELKAILADIEAVEADDEEDE